MDKKELFKLAKQDVYQAISLHVGMCCGFIEVADNEEFLESFYYLKFWQKKLGSKSPDPLLKAITMFEDFILRKGFLDQKHLDFWFEEKAKIKGDFQDSWSSSYSAELTSTTKEDEDVMSLFLFLPPNGGLPS